MNCISCRILGERWPRELQVSRGTLVLLSSVILIELETDAERIKSSTIANHTVKSVVPNDRVIRHRSTWLIDRDHGMDQIAHCNIPCLCALPVSFGTVFVNRIVVDETAWLNTKWLYGYKGILEGFKEVAMRFLGCCWWLSWCYVVTRVF